MERFALQDLGKLGEADLPDLDTMPQNDASLIVSAWLARDKGIPLEASYLDQDAALTEDLTLATYLYNQAYQRHRDTAPDDEGETYTSDLSFLDNARGSSIETLFNG